MSSWEGEAWVRAADEALYAARQQGRDRVLGAPATLARKEG